ncbi:MAG TPA: BON domain-containing protein [Kofleriaceae bacterium]|nr:BON domain-containing protein [Kofleriaceae bacterium]
MPNQNGRNEIRGNERSYRPQDDGDRMTRQRDQHRDDDHHERDDSSRTTERYGGGQSGYGAGRMGDDRSMGPGYRNQSRNNARHDDGQGMHTDDRYSGRGGSGYWQDRNDRTDRGDYNSGYNQGGMGYGGQGAGMPANVERHQGFRGGSAGAQVGGGTGGHAGDDQNRRYPDMYGPDENYGTQHNGRFGQGGNQERASFREGVGYGQGNGGRTGAGTTGEGPQRGGASQQGSYGPQSGYGGYGTGGYAGGRGGGQQSQGGGQQSHGGTHGGHSGQGYGGGQSYGGGGGVHGGPGGGHGYGGTYGDSRGNRDDGGRTQRPGNFGPGYGQGAHRGKGPQGYTRSDDRIKELVCEALADDEHIDATHIEIVVKNGEVILTGTVEDRHQKRLAEDITENMPGVKDVQNNLRVGRPQSAQSGPSNQSSNQGGQASAVGKNETETSTTSAADKKPRA